MLQDKLLQSFSRDFLAQEVREKIFVMVQNYLSFFGKTN